MELLALLLFFVASSKQIEESIAEVIPLLSNDAVLWYCYPKSSSKRYICDINRDIGWESLGAIGLEAVRQVALDNDWSALRFRHISFI